MTTLLYRRDPYLQECEARVLGHTPEGGIIADRSIFYPQGGGQPGDSGLLLWEQGRIAIATALRQPGGELVLVPSVPVSLPPKGAQIRQRLDWSRRHRHMRMHTALHLLSVVIARPVCGGQIGAGRGWLDFSMTAMARPRAELEKALNSLAGQDLRVSESWVSDEELTREPGLTTALASRPATAQGRLRMISIGEGEGRIDFQPCGGTHVARTGEIGTILVDRIEEKGRQSRRISLRLDS